MDGVLACRGNVDGCSNSAANIHVIEMMVPLWRAAPKAQVTSCTLHVRSRAVAVVGVARGAATMAAGSPVVVMRLALYDDAIAGVVVTVDEESKDEGDEKHDAVPARRQFSNLEISNK